MGSGSGARGRYVRLCALADCAERAVQEASEGPMASWPHRGAWVFRMRVLVPLAGHG